MYSFLLHFVPLPPSISYFWISFFTFHSITCVKSFVPSLILHPPLHLPYSFFNINRPFTTFSTPYSVLTFSCYLFFLLLSILLSHHPLRLSTPLLCLFLLSFKPSFVHFNLSCNLSFSFSPLYHVSLDQ